MQSDIGKIKDLPFAGPQQALTVLKHWKLAKEIKVEYHWKLGVEQENQNGARTKNVDRTLKDEAAFCTRKENGIDHKRVQLSYATGVLLLDSNSSDQSLPGCQLSWTRSSKRRARPVIYWSRDDDSFETELSWTTFLSVCRRYVKTWSINTAKEVTLPRHLDRMAGMNNCMYYIGGPFRYFPFHLHDEQLSSISFLCYGAPKLWYIIQFSN